MIHPTMYLSPFGQSLPAETLNAINALLDDFQVAPISIAQAQTGEAIGLIAHNAATQSLLNQLRPALRTIAELHQIDLALQSHAQRHSDYRLICFDMDSTLIEQEVMDEIAKVAGIGEHIAHITDSAMRGEITFKESFSKRLALLKGFPTSALPEIAKKLSFSPGAVELVHDLRARGLKIAIFSGGFSYFAEGLQTELGTVDYIHSNELEILDDQLTGKITNQLVNETRKAELIQSIAAELNISLDQTLAVGDGANDIPMLNLAGMGIAYRAKPIVRENTSFQVSFGTLDSVRELLAKHSRL